MTILTEGPLNAGFLVSEGDAYYSRDAATVTVPSGGLEAGTVLGRITATGVYVRHNTGLSNGAETAAAVLLMAQPEAGDMSATVIARHAQVRGPALIYADGANAAAMTATDAALADVGIIVRKEG